MELKLYKTLWGHQGNLEDAIDLVREAGFQGIEGPAPTDPAAREIFYASLAGAELEWIAEVSTCTAPGFYVPSHGKDVQAHLHSLDEGISLSLEGKPRFINTMAGYDAWSASDALKFHQGVVDLQNRHSIIISVETHRGRSTYSPWLTRDILKAIPELRITCDFSHWCVVSERLILDEEHEILDLAAAHAHHIQPRVGYNQGPQVPDPRAPEYAEALAAHERWWSIVWDSMASRSVTEFTMTPEFGPDGYLQHTPFTQIPAADLWDVNRWIGHRQRDRFNQKFQPAFASFES